MKLYIEEEHDKLNHCLCISDERQEFLVQELQVAALRSNTYTEMFDRLAKLCDNHQELAYIFYHFGRLDMMNDTQAEQRELLAKLGLL